MPKRPSCGTEAITVLKEWDYSIFHVKQIICEKCNRPFKAYFLHDKLSHTIPKLSITRMRIIDYLRMHDGATEFEIVEALQLYVAEVQNALKKLKKEGTVVSFLTH